MVFSRLYRFPLAEIVTYQLAQFGFLDVCAGNFLGHVELAKQGSILGGEANA